MPKPSGVNSAFSNIGSGANMGDARPAAYLNYILFDQNYTVMDAGWQVVPAESFSKQQVTIPTVTAKQAGYIFVYLSYEGQSDNYVYFDDFKVTITPTNIVQNNEYYAHGLPTADSWTRDNAVANNFLGNGGTELNATSSLYDLDYRSYDPVLGRLNQVDPMADYYSSHSPYHYSFNDPIGFNDPSGADPFLHPPDGPYDWFGFNTGMGRDQAWAKGGGDVRSDGKSGYFNDTNGDGIQNGDETIVGKSDLNAIFGENTVSIVSGERLGWKDGILGYYDDEGYVNLYAKHGRTALEVIAGKWSPLASLLNKAKDDEVSPFARDKDMIFNGASTIVGLFQAVADAALKSRPAGYSAEEWAKTLKVGKAVTKALNILGLGITYADFKTSKEVSNAHIMDATFGVIGLLPGIGTAISLAYFIPNALSVMFTDKSLGQHLDGYMDVWAKQAAYEEIQGKK